MASHQEIFDNAQARIAELQEIEIQLERDVVAIQRKEFDHPLSADDNAQIDALRSGKAAVRQVMSELTVVTLEALDRSDDLQHLNTVVGDTVKNLKKTADRIARIGKAAEMITKVLGGVQKLGKQLEKLSEEEQTA